MQVVVVEALTKKGWYLELPWLSEGPSFLPLHPMYRSKTHLGQPKHPHYHPINPPQSWPRKAQCLLAWVTAVRAE